MIHVCFRPLSGLGVEARSGTMMAKKNVETFQSSHMLSFYVFTRHNERKYHAYTIENINAIIK